MSEKKVKFYKVVVGSRQVYRRVAREVDDTLADLCISQQFVPNKNSNSITSALTGNSNREHNIQEQSINELYSNFNQNLINDEQNETVYSESCEESYFLM